MAYKSALRNLEGDLWFIENCMTKQKLLTQDEKVSLTSPLRQTGRLRSLEVMYVVKRDLLGQLDIRKIALKKSRI